MQKYISGFITAIEHMYNKTIRIIGWHHDINNVFLISLYESKSLCEYHMVFLSAWHLFYCKYIAHKIWLPVNFQNKGFYFVSLFSMFKCLSVCVTAVLSPLRFQWSPTCSACPPHRCCTSYSSSAVHWCWAPPWTGSGCFVRGVQWRWQAAPGWWLHGWFQ